jgi:AraC-like DNA-binding protein
MAGYPISPAAAKVESAMLLCHHLLHFGERIELARDDDSLHLLRASGRGVQLDVPNGWVSLCWPLHGSVSMTAPGSDWQLKARDLQVWREGPLRCRSQDAHSWLVLTGPASVWGQGTRPSHRQEAVFLFPWRGRIAWDTARLLVLLARHGQDLSSATDDDSDALIVALSACLLEQQQDLQRLLPHCSGRTLSRRQQTLLRLLRVRHQIQCNPDTRLELEQLASTASYSPCHLIRLYRSVFGETPSEYATRLREQRAWSMVSTTGLPICEITEMLGFESQSAFCRAFKSTFGRTTSEVRRTQLCAQRVRAA